MRARFAILLAALAGALPKDAADWTTYGQNYAGWRFSELAQINTGNVANLRTAWIYQTGVSGGFQTTPLVFDGQMYVTGASNHAWALDALTVRASWSYHEAVPRGIDLCCGRPNRGFAVAGDTLYNVNLDATLVALDRKTGRKLWEPPIYG